MSACIRMDLGSDKTNRIIGNKKCKMNRLYLWDDHLDFKCLRNEMYTL